MSSKLFNAFNAQFHQFLHLGLTDKFGFFYGRNGSDWWDGIFNMFTGVDDPTKLGSIAKWFVKTQKDFFSSFVYA